MEPNTEVELVLASVLHHVFIGCDAAGLHRFGRNLLFLETVN